MSKVFKTMDGNEAAAYISYAFTEVATIYPITPSSPMAELVDVWSANGKKNIFGQTVRLVEMQSEHGAAGAMHGSLEAGALTTSYTASQGLMLMVPAMYRMSGQLHPGVLHVSARTVGTHAMSIFGDHSDVMATRHSGFALLSTGSVQEVMDLAAVAHLSAIKGRVPFLHFFDGFRTSHEIQKIECLDYADLEKMVDYKALAEFRKRSLNPERPVQRTTVQNPDIFFQMRESCNRFYEALPAIVEDYMAQINALTGRDYHLFNYYGAPDAERVIVAMGSVSGVAREVVEYLCAQGQKVGYLQVHLFRPFSVEHLLGQMPQTVKKISVLDRTKEPGSLGEPLYEDICTAYTNRENAPKIYAGRYGLSSKDVTPAQMIAVFDNMLEEEPKNHFTVGIDDDVTHHSLTVGPDVETGHGAISCKFWGLGSDGTVGANKNSIKIIGDHTGLYAQAYFEYDTKKSGGITKSHLRFGKNPILSSYLVTRADFIACHNQSYLDKYDIVNELKEGGTFLLNCSWPLEELEQHLPGKVKRQLAEKHAKFYVIDASTIAQEIGLGGRTNTVLQAAFFSLANIIPTEEAVQYMKDAIHKSYFAKGEKVLQMNDEAVDRGIGGVHQVEVPAGWAACRDEPVSAPADLPDFVRNVMLPMNSLKGDSLPVSRFVGMEDGTLPFGTSKYEKRGVAAAVPHWDASKCIQCNRCSLVCPHAAIRPVLLSEAENTAAPAGFDTLAAAGAPGLSYRIQVDVLDCTGCGCCATACPAREKALTMRPLEEERDQQPLWDYSLTVSGKKNPMNKFTIKGSQFEEPLVEFSGACAGCGETPYVKLMTQLYGDRMYLANATGCTQAWGASAPCVPYTTNRKGHGPAWSNSLFENNAEFSLGMCLAVRQQREQLAMRLERIAATAAPELKAAIEAWQQHYDESEGTVERTEALVAQLEQASGDDVAYVLENREHLTKKSMWMYGGDGWAYDIGYGGLDHVLASGEDVNILVVDTEVYSNTGGQASKATGIGAVAQFAASGKKVQKKDLGMLAMSYGYIYVAQVALGADPNQLIRALKEAEEYHGPSLIIAYAPCINHGIVKGMSYAQEESKLAVESGYWNLYRFHPGKKARGENPFTLDSKAPSRPLRDFLMGEVRYAALTRTFPEIAEELIALAEEHAREKYAAYEKLAAGNGIF